MALLAFPRSSLRCTGGAQNVRKIAMPSLLPSHLPNSFALSSLFLSLPSTSLPNFLSARKPDWWLVAGGRVSGRGRDYSRVDQETMF